MSFVVAMLIAVTFLQPVQAHLISGEGGGGWSLSAPLDSNSHGLPDSEFYIAEENDGQFGRKGQTHRLGLGDPLTVVSEVPAAALISLIRYAPHYRTPLDEGGLFLSPLKTGPPSI